MLAPQLLIIEKEPYLEGRHIEQGSLGIGIDFSMLVRIDYVPKSRSNGRTELQFELPGALASKKQRLFLRQRQTGH